MKCYRSISNDDTVKTVKYVVMDMALDEFKYDKILVISALCIRGTGRHDTLNISATPCTKSALSQKTLS